MRVEKIGPKNARALGRLEAEIYPSGFCLGWQDFEKDLKQAEISGGNFSFGLFEGNQMIGYLIAYTNNGEIYVSDFAVLPSYRVNGGPVTLVKAFLKSASQAGLSFYCECRKCSYIFWQRNRDLFFQNGYQLNGQPELLRNYNNGENHYKLYFELCTRN